MFSSGILDVAIGLAFIYLLYSLLATTVQETLAVALNLRSRKLQMGIKQMLTDTNYKNVGEVLTGWLRALFNNMVSIRKLEKPPLFKSASASFGATLTGIKDLGEHLLDGNPIKAPTASRNSELWRRFYDHPIIKNYGEGRLSKYPSYLPAGNFSAILIDVLKSDMDEFYVYLAKAQFDASKAAEKRPAQENTEHTNTNDTNADAAQVEVSANKDTATDVQPTVTNLKTEAEELSEIKEVIKKAWSEKSLVDQLTGLFEYSKEHGNPIPKETAHILCMMLVTADKQARLALDGVATVPQPQVPLKPGEVSTEQIVYKTIELFKVSLEKWFNDSMDRVTGWYKRQTQVMLILIGIFIAVCFDVDTVQIASKLSVDKDARKQIADMATAYVSSHKDTYIPGTSITVGGKSVPLVADSVRAAKDEKKYDSLVDYAQTLLKKNIDNTNNYLAMGYDGLGQDDPEFATDFILNGFVSKYGYQKRLKQFQNDAHDSLLAEKDSLTEQIALEDSLYEMVTNKTIRKYYAAFTQLQKSLSDSLQTTTKNLGDLPQVPLAEQDSFNSLLNRQRKWVGVKRSNMNGKQEGMNTALNVVPYNADFKKMKDQSILITRTQLAFLQDSIDDIGVILKTIERFNLLRASDSLKTDSFQIKALAKLKGEINLMHRRLYHIIQYSTQITEKKAIAKLYTTWYQVPLAFQYVWYETFTKCKWMGFLITAMAISLGSPFWFDLLNKFMQLRGAVKDDSNTKLQQGNNNN